MKRVGSRLEVVWVLSILFAFIVSFPHFAQSAASQPKELQLSYEEFDQDPQGGWRRLSNEGKYVEAAQLIDRYEKEKEDLNGGDRVILSFHAAQMYAFAGDSEKALTRLKKAKYPPEVLAQAEDVRPYAESWNLYVDATMAFLDKDRDGLKKSSDLLEKGPKDQGLQKNIDIVHQLLLHFDETYLVAYSGKK